MIITVDLEYDREEKEIRSTSLLSSLLNLLIS